jgi:adenylate cyclase class IV
MSSPGQNIEIKARIRDVAAARQLVEGLCGPPQAELLQTDTYFGCRQGRLKLREMPNAAQLIWYERPDAAAPRASHYRLVPVADPQGTRAALAAACGVRCVVAKRRQLYWYRNVRVHLDEVAGLGHFLELEAVVTDGTGACRDAALPEAPSAGAAPEAEQAARQLVDWLCGRLGIEAADLLHGSYADMMAAAD